MTTTITVEGMSCEHCERTIEEALQGVSGASDARADRASVSFSPPLSKTNPFSSSPRMDGPIMPRSWKTISARFTTDVASTS
jgi:copper chaperone CopZ